MCKTAEWFAFVRLLQSTLQIASDWQSFVHTTGTIQSIYIWQYSLTAQPSTVCHAITNCLLTDTFFTIPAYSKTQVTCKTAEGKSSRLQTVITWCYAHIFPRMNIKHIITVPNYPPWQGEHRENEDYFQNITQVASYLRIWQWTFLQTFHPCKDRLDKCMFRTTL